MVAGDADIGPGDRMMVEELCRSFYYGDRADMQFKFLNDLPEGEAADAIARILAAVGEVLDTGELDRLYQIVYEAQLRGYAPEQPVEPPADVPFIPLDGELSELTLALISAGGVFVADDDPMGPDAPSQRETLDLITEFLRGAPTLTAIRVDTPKQRLTARHPGYDANTAQRDPSTVFPLDHLRDAAAAGRVRLTDEHYAFVGATSQRRLEHETAPRWAQEMAGRDVDLALLVAT